MQTNLKLSQFFQAFKIFSFSRLLRKILRIRNLEKWKELIYATLLLCWKFFSEFFLLSQNHTRTLK